jgi:hypothetical protein
MRHASASGSRTGRRTTARITKRRTLQQIISPLPSNEYLVRSPTHDSDVSLTVLMGSLVTLDAEGDVRVVCPPHSELLRSRVRIQRLLSIVSHQVSLQ